ncbi:MAG: DUF3553 domain-containing protein [Gemmataceae bacterium]|nr:DUF3553 domain-containing protein [Gemmataceae bacterium]
MTTSARGRRVNWQPERFAVGDAVTDPDRPGWGVGRVVEDRTVARSPTTGQRLLVEWAGRGRVSVLTATRPLRRVSAAPGGQKS